MRLVLSIFISFFISVASAEYTVFEKEGYYGIMDENGQVSVPAVYEYLGWTEGTSKIKSGVIGYRDGDLWGLITAKNKVIVAPTYHSIAYFKNDLIKASIKGKFSNQLFYGILNSLGKTFISFNYFSIEEIGNNLLVSQYDRNQILYGVISFSSRQILPPEYLKIYADGGLFFATSPNKTIDIYHSTGSIISSGINWMDKTSRGWIVSKNGYRGFIGLDGQIVYDFKCKDIHLDNDILYPVSFPTWKVFNNQDLIFEVDADSLQYAGIDFSQVYLNGVETLALLDSTIAIENAVLKQATTNHFIFRDIRDDGWFVLNKQGLWILDQYDSIYASEFALWGRLKDVWTIHNRYGKKKNRFSYDHLINGVDGQFITRLNGYFGLLDPLGVEITRFKYEEIIVDLGHYKVKYLGKWGIMDSNGEWLLRPEFSEVFVRPNLLIGRKGVGYTYLGRGNTISKFTFSPRHEIGELLLIEGEDGLFGLMDHSASIKVYPKYKSINYWNGFYELVTNNEVSILDNRGSLLVSPEGAIQKVGGVGEDYLLIKKNDKWGFLDHRGRLRISNRYSNARPFNEGLAAIKLRNSWGFIDKNERIVIQPYYDEVSDFKAGLSIVLVNGQYGLINELGDEVVKAKWNKIKRLTTGNYLVIDELKRVGLISSSGKFLLRPSFDTLEDIDGQVIISNHNKKGVLDYDGNQIFKTRFKEIKISGSYTILKY